MAAASRRRTRQRRPLIRSGVIAGETFGFKEVLYVRMGTRAVVEGDIVLDLVDLPEPLPSPTQEDLLVEGLIVAPSLRWPAATLPFRVDGQLAGDARIAAAIDHWQDRTPIRFTPHGGAPDFVEFVPSFRCFSRVGCRHIGRQAIEVSGACSAGDVIHEIGHAIGLWHEQSRSDRDQFIEILRDNIAPARLATDFAQQLTDADEVGPYDFDSIMHYLPNEGAIDPGRPTIRARDGRSFGQRVRLSPGDIAAVEALYS